MEVDKIGFYPLLLDILTDISEAHFIAFDLELSGVPVKSSSTSRLSGKPTLQERYLETKAAAEKYQILQIGLTCVKQDVENKKYILQPYNFELSPIIEERIDVDRDFAFNSSAVDFLLRVHFDLSVPFYRGVPYLSRKESRLAREKFSQRQDRSAIADIQIKPTEFETLAFVDRVRQKINKWLPNSGTSLDITKDTVDEEGEPHGLSRFEKRLVHQVVRAEFPDLVTIGRHDRIEIVHFDKEREDRIAADRLKDLNQRINKQKGFRWVIEALVGSHLANLDLKECAKDPITGEYIVYDQANFKAQFHRAHALIASNPRTIVGHNCFLDLVYIYRAFIGELPDTVDGFAQKLHSLWPQIIDTKYLATHDCGDVSPVSALEEIAHNLKEQPTPMLELDKEHQDYAERGRPHEAGYDSYLTAQIAIRLSTGLGEREGYTRAPPNRLDKDLANSVDRLHLDEPSSIALDSKATQATSQATSQAPSHGFTPSEPGGKWKCRGDPSLPPTDPNDLLSYAYNPRESKHRSANTLAKQSFDGGMPSFDNGFWKVYGNKLRVFGTVESVCNLGAEALEKNGEVNADGGVSVSAT